MPLSYVTALTYCVLPTAVAYLAGLAFMAPIRETARLKPRLKGPGLVMMALPLTSVIFANVAATLASNPTAKNGLEWALLVLAASGVVTICAQAFVIRTGFPSLSGEATPDPGFGKLLMRAVIPETMVLIGFVYFIMQWIPAKA